MLKSSSISFVAQNQLGNSEVISVVSHLPTYTNASNSVVLSSAAYIAWKYPTLQHPWYPNKDLSNLPETEQTHENVNLSLHPLFEGWCDIISESILNGEAIRHNDELYTIVRVPLSVIAQLEQFGAMKLTHEGKATVDMIYGLDEIKINKKKIALMNFATSQLRTDQLQPKINILGLLLGCLFNNQKFDYFPILKGEIPTKSQLVEYDSIIMPGSSYSAMDSVPEIDLFISELKQALDENKNLKVLSICFGHQAISKMYGASIVRKTRIQGQEHVGFIPEIIEKYEFLSGLKKFCGRKLMMPEHHTDYVQDVPVGFELLASSESCKVEALVSNCGKILSFQFHPEYLSDYAISFENRLSKAQPEHKLSFHLGVSEDKKEQHLSACTEVRNCMQKFLA